MLEGNFHWDHLWEEKVKDSFSPTPLPVMVVPPHTLLQIKEEKKRYRKPKLFGNARNGEAEPILREGRQMIEKEMAGGHPRKQLEQSSRME